MRLLLLALVAALLSTKTTPCLAALVPAAAISLPEDNRAFGFTRSAFPLPPMWWQNKLAPTPQQQERWQLRLIPLVHEDDVLFGGSLLARSIPDQQHRNSETTAAAEKESTPTQPQQEHQQSGAVPKLSLLLNSTNTRGKCGGCPHWGCELSSVGAS